MKFNPPSSIIMCNAKNEMAYKILHKPNEIITLKKIRMWRAFSPKIEIYKSSIRREQFMLVDQHDESIRVIPSLSTELYATRIQRTDDLGEINKSLRN